MIGPEVSSTHGSGTVDVHLIPTPRDDEVDHMPVSVPVSIGVAFPNPMFVHDQGPLVIFSSYPRIVVSYQQQLICTRDATEHIFQLVVEGLLVFIWVCHCWSVHAGNCSKVVVQR